MPDKKSFIFYDDWGLSFALLSPEDQSRLLMAILEYHRTGTVSDLDGGAAMAFSFIRAQIDRDSERYIRRCERNRQNGAKGGRPKKTDGIPENPPKPKKSERLKEKPKKPDTDTDDDNEDDTDDDNDNDIKEITVGATAPTRPTFITLPLKSNEEYAVSEVDTQEWGRLYPAVDVGQELRKMRGWLEANPARRKTQRGIRRFINSWLSGEQDKRQSSGDNGISGMKFAN